MKTSASTGEGPSSDASDTAKTAAAIVGGSLLASAGLVGSHVLVEPLTAYFNAIGVPVIEFLHPPEWVS